MTKEEAKEYIYECLDHDEATEVIKALEQQPCEDCVSRQAVLEWIKGSLEQYANTYSIDMLNMWMLFEEQIVAMPSVTPTQRWIPVSERLPENDEVVLGTNSSNDLFQTYTWDDCGEVKWYADGCFDVPVVAWMPLPKPYEAESEGE